MVNGLRRKEFDVRKGNERVIAFHQRFGANITDEDELNYYFNYSIQNYLNIKKNIAVISIDYIFRFKRH